MYPTAMVATATGGAGASKTGARETGRVPLGGSLGQEADARGRRGF